MLSLDLKDVPIGKGLIVSIGVFGSLMAPFWFIFQFYHDLFKQTDLIKLLLIALSIGFPVSLYNMYNLTRNLASYSYEHPIDEEAMKQHHENDQNEFFINLALAGIYTIFSFYLPCILSYFWKMSTNTAVLFVAGVEVLVFIYFQFNLWLWPKGNINVKAKIPSNAK